MSNRADSSWAAMTFATKRDFAEALGGAEPSATTSFHKTSACPGNLQ